MAAIDLRIKGDQPGGLNRQTRRMIARLFRKPRTKPRQIQSHLVTARPHTPAHKRERNVIPVPAGAMQTLQHKLAREMNADLQSRVDHALMHGSHP